MFVWLFNLNVQKQHSGQSVRGVIVKIHLSISASEMILLVDILKTAQFLIFYNQVTLLSCEDKCITDTM